ncbi:MAG: hypothetical protein ACP5E3_09725 [Bacteroidales bacterium]
MDIKSMTMTMSILFNTTIDFLMDILTFCFPKFNKYIFRFSFDTMSKFMSKITSDNLFGTINFDILT